MAASAGYSLRPGSTGVPSWLSGSTRKNLSPLQELAVSNAYEVAALVAGLERKGILT
jgi:hypothetical protein